MTVIYRGNGDAQQATLFEAEALRTNPQDFPDLVMPTPRRRKQEAEHDHAE
jgi:hypothetical protein